MAIEIKRDPSNIDGAVMWADEGPSFQPVVDLQIQEARYMKKAVQRMDSEGGMSYGSKTKIEDPTAGYNPGVVRFVSRIEAASNLVVLAQDSTPSRIVDPTELSMMMFGRKDPDLVDHAVGLAEIGAKAIRTGKGARDVFDRIAAVVTRRRRVGGAQQGS